MQIREIIKNNSLIIGIVIVIFFFTYARLCHIQPDKGQLTLTQKQKYCNEFEWHGLSMSHFMIFACIGFVFPEQFWFVQAGGILFEIGEYVLGYYVNKYLECRPNTPMKCDALAVGAWHILNLIGGRHYYPPGKTNHHVSIDYWIQVPSERHWWHVKITDVLMNVLGFAFGYMCYAIYERLLSSK
jgi:hypothetical protein